MARPTAPRPVKIFAGLVANDEALFPPVEARLAELFGRVDCAGPVMPWLVSGYYEPEMGAPLWRRFVSFEPLRAPEMLPEFKWRAREVEAEYAAARSGRTSRRVNIDPGYLDRGKVVLASTKDAGHRLYLGGGIYGEITLLFQSGGFQPLAYTYRDFLWPETRAFLAGLRAAYLSQLRGAG